MGEPALFRRYPALADRIPWVSLGTFPTPVEPLAPAAAERIGADIWIKRDDVSGERYGGNKVRKLELLLADAQREGAQRLTTLGAIGSHHALATTVYGRALDFDITLVLFPQPVTPHVRRVLLLDRAYGAELRFARGLSDVPTALLSARLAHRGERVLSIPAGGSNAYGTLGYVSAALELSEQIAAGAAPPPDVVHVAAGTLGTAVGIALGFALARLEAYVIGTRITSRVVTNTWALRRLAGATTRLLERVGVAVPPATEVLRRIAINHDQVGRGYGYETAAGREAAELFAHGGITLDQTYTAKAGAELIASVRAGTPGVHLFWYTLSAVHPAEVADRVDLADLPPPFRALLR